MRLEASAGLLCFGVGGGFLMFCLQTVLTVGNQLEGGSFLGLIMGFFAFLILGLGLYLIIDDGTNKNR
jgi:hypothetical protein